MEVIVPVFKLVKLKTSNGLKILNKYLVIEIFSYAFETDMIKARFALLNKIFNKFSTEYH